MNETDLRFLRASIELARKARKKGNHPFGSLLADGHGQLLLEAENTVTTQHDCTGHAETNLCRLASQRYDRDFLAQCTLYTSAEPCPMCAGAIYWSNVGRVVYGLSAARLARLVAGSSENPPLLLPCREIFARGQRQIEVIGPALEDEAERVHEGFWDKKG
jgi:tRNA(Arg) A34 adenosine deaminase TadA